MRIVQALGWYYPDSLGGTEVYVAELCRLLQAAGHEVLVAAPDPGRDEERHYDHEGISVYRYPISRRPSRAEAQGLSTVRGCERFHRWLAAQRPDVVHVHTFVTGLGLAELKAAKMSGARLIVTTHSASLGWVCQRGTMMRWGETLCDGICQPVKCAACELQHRGLPKSLAQRMAAIPLSVARAARVLPGKLGTALSMRDLIARNQARQREMLEVVDNFVLLTTWARDAVAANGAPANKLILNRLGCGQTNVDPKPGPDEQPTTSPIMVGYLGRFEASKGVHDLARAVASLPAGVPVEVEFRGPVNSASELDCVNELGQLVRGDPRVTFAPPVPRQEVSDVLRSYDLVCCPARTLEGGPTVALEAYAVGTPVVGSRVGGLAELVSDGINGRLLAPGDWRALAVTLSEIAYDPGATVDRWRKSLPATRTMDKIVADYLVLYQLRN